MLGLACYFNLALRIFFSNATITCMMGWQKKHPQTSPTPCSHATPSWLVFMWQEVKSNRAAHNMKYESLSVLLKTRAITCTQARNSCCKLKQQSSLFSTGFKGLWWAVSNNKVLIQSNKHQLTLVSEQMVFARPAALCVSRWLQHNSAANSNFGDR